VLKGMGCTLNSALLLYDRVITILMLRLCSILARLLLGLLAMR